MNWLNCDLNDTDYEQLTDEVIQNVINPEKSGDDECMN